MYLCDDDQTSAIVQNRDGEYFVVTEQSDCEQVCRDSQVQSLEDERTPRRASRASYTRKGQQYKTLLAGMLAVALAFSVVIPLGFWLRPRYSFVSEQILGTILALVLVGISAGVMRLIGGPLWPKKKRESGPLRYPDPDMDPTKEWSSNGAGCRTGYEISFHDFRRLISDPESQLVIGPLLTEWYRYEIVGQGPETVVRSAEGQVVGLRVLHNLIQIDRLKQRTIYDRAMDLWR